LLASCGCLNLAAADRERAAGAPPKSGGLPKTRLSHAYTETRANDFGIRRAIRF
jgi:hypothetical protein